MTTTPPSTTPFVKFTMSGSTFSSMESPSVPSSKTEPTPALNEKKESKRKTRKSKKDEIEYKYSRWPVHLGSEKIFVAQKTWYESITLVNPKNKEEQAVIKIGSAVNVAEKET